MNVVVGLYPDASELFQVIVGFYTDFLNFALQDVFYFLRFAALAHLTEPVSGFLVNMVKAKI